jgi:hypothetical protein
MWHLRVEVRFRHYFTLLAARQDRIYGLLACPAAIAGQHGVVVPATLLERIEGLSRDVKHIRDKFIVHPSGPNGHLIRRVASVEQGNKSVYLQ